MKPNLKKVMAAVVFGLFSFGVFAQKAPRWVSEKGYWVVESNIHHSETYTISYYNNDHVLVHKKSLIGMKLNVEKRKTKMKLKKELETYIVEWEVKNKTKKDEEWVKGSK